MTRQRSLWFVIVLLTLAALACNAFSGQEPTLAPPTVDGPPAATADSQNGEGAPAPTATLAGAGDGSSTGDEPMVTVLVDLNVRSGPGVVYDIVSFLLEGSRARIVGRDAESGWWKIACPADAQGEECWVSGGEQYTMASNNEGVPIAEAPPMPTPKPPELGPGVGLVVYVENGRLSLGRIDLNQDPPTAGDPIQLVESRDVVAAYIAPDGRRVAYVTQTDEGNALNVVNVNGKDERTLLESADLPQPEDEDDLIATIGRVAWLPDSTGLIFNTNLTNLVGPGLGSQEDLWTVMLDGTVTEQLRAEEGGGLFAIAPANNQVLLSRAEGIWRANLSSDTLDPEPVLSFEFINTASEYIYYPQPQWTADGNSAYVAVPAPEPFAEETEATLWRIPALGRASEIGRLPGNILFTPVQWTDDGNYLAYVQQSPDSSQPALITANADGSNARPYTTGQQLELFGWSRNNQDFLFAGRDYFAIGRVGAEATRVPLPNDTAIGDAQWLTAESYVISLQPGGSGSWRLTGGNLKGDTVTLVEFNGRPVQIQVWGP